MGKFNEEKIRDEILINKELKDEYLNKNYFVEAGAGAGKTHIIVERIINQIKLGVPIEKIVVITFTNKAANEIRNRIIQRVNEEATKKENSKFKEYLEKANENIGNMQMSTIHSFCLKILKEQTFDANLRLDMRLVQEEGEENEARLFFNPWYDGKWAEIKKLKEKLEPLGYWVNYGNIFDAFYGMINEFNMNDFIIEEGILDNDEMYKKCLALIDDKEKAKEAKENIEEIVKKIKIEIKDVDDKIKAYNKIKKEIDEKNEKIKEYADKEKKGEKLTKVQENAKVNKANEIKELKEKLAEFNIEKLQKDKEIKDKKIEELQSGVKDVDTAILDAYIGISITNFLNPIVKEYRETNRNKLLTNNDLLRKTKALFENNEKIRDIYKNKYSCIYVDEFQDTNQVQLDMLRNMLLDGDGRIRKGSLFVVGDPKQSIYRFQGADLQAYNNFKKYFDDDEIYTLNWNYRSNNKILSFINEQNKKIFDEYDSNLDKNEAIYKIDYENMVSPNIIKEDEFKTKHIEDPDLIYGIYKVDELKEKNGEPNCLCSIINNMVSKKAKIVVYDKDEKTYKEKEVEYRDFLIISPGKTSMQTYINLLNNADIPTQFTLDEKNNNIKEMYKFVYIYSYLINPFYVKAKYAATNTLYYELKKDIEMDEHVKNRLKILHDNTKTLDNYAKALYLIDHYNLIFSHETLSPIEAKHLQIKLRQMLEEVIVKYDAFDLLDGFYEYINNTIDGDIVLDDNPNVVRFMNLHKSKGLEGNIVICACRDDRIREFKKQTYHKASGNSVDYYYSVNGGFFGKNGNKPSYGFNDEIMKKAEREEMAEFDRLAYVECTRAKSALIFMPTKKQNEYFCKYDLSNVKALDSKWIEEVSNNGKIEYEEYEESDRLIPDVKFKNNLFTASPSSYENSKGIKREGGSQTSTRIAGATYGIIMHRGFELLVKEKLKEKDIEYVLDRAILENIADIKIEFNENLNNSIKRIKEQLRDTYTKFFKNKQLQDIINDKNSICYTEYHFNLLGDEGIEKDYYITGQADLMVNNGDKLYIIDYKSDNDEGYKGNEFTEGLKRAYGEQLAFYKLIMGKVFTGVKEIVTYIYNNDNLIEVQGEIRSLDKIKKGKN